MRKAGDINNKGKKENEEKSEAEVEESVSLPSRQDPLSILKSHSYLFQVKESKKFQTTTFSSRANTDY